MKPDVLRASSAPRPARRLAPARALTLATMPSPVGLLRLFATATGLAGIHFPDRDPAAPVPVPSDDADEHPVLRLAIEQLAEYFAGRRTTFALPLAPVGTPFQHKVWAALAAIPYAQTRSYLQIARAIGSPAAMRAVGAANGRNPLSIVVPCHRVIGANGTLTGFGGGLDAKRWLLDHEQRFRMPA